MTASRRSVGLNYFQTGLRILFTIFFWTKTQLWKLMWAFLGCCIGNNSSPVHSLMRWFIYTLHFAMAISLHDAMKIFINRPSIDNFSLMHVISSGLSFCLFSVEFFLSWFVWAKLFVLVGVITRIPLLFSVPLSTMVVRSMVYYQYSSTLSILSYCELHLAGVKGLIDFKNWFLHFNENTCSLGSALYGS